MYRLCFFFLFLYCLKCERKLIYKEFHDVASFTISPMKKTYYRFEDIWGYIHTHLQYVHSYELYIHGSNQETFKKFLNQLFKQYYDQVKHQLMITEQTFVNHHSFLSRTNIQNLVLPHISIRAPWYKWCLTRCYKLKRHSAQRAIAKFRR